MQAEKSHHIVLVDAIAGDANCANQLLATVDRHAAGEDLQAVPLADEAPALTSAEPLVQSSDPTSERLPTGISWSQGRGYGQAGSVAVIAASYFGSPPFLLDADLTGGRGSCQAAKNK